MFTKTRATWSSLLLAMAIMLWAGSATIAQDSNWHVSKASGDVWFTSTDAQPVALTNTAIIRAGDTVRTGPNGRALLVRGAESILVSANSIVSIPANQSDGRATTTIFQQAGTILLDVERRNVQHFEVATPYLAAVVKGTQFQVTVNNIGTQVSELRGQVQVSDYRSGQYVLVNQDQTAQVASQQPGLSVSGRGVLNSVQQGTPSRSAISPITIPKEGFTAPDLTQNRPRNQTPVPERHAQAQSSSPSPDVTRQQGPASRFVTWGKEILTQGGRQNRDDDMTLILAFTGFTGLFVAVGAAIFRRKPKNKK